MPHQVVDRSASSALAEPSVLFPTEPVHRDSPKQPACFDDLNLGRLVTSIVADREDYDLTGYFHLPLSSVEAVKDRLAVFTDLDQEMLWGGIKSFGDRMRVVRAKLAYAEKVHYPLLRQRTILGAAATYLDAVTLLHAALAGASLSAEGLRQVRDHMARHVGTPEFRSLQGEARPLLDRLDEVRFRLRIFSGTVQVSAVDDGEPDYAEDVESFFERFRQGEVQSYLSKEPDRPGMDHVEAAIAGFVAKLYPQTFAMLSDFAARHSDFLDPGVLRFDREIQFFLAYRDLMTRVGGAKLPFCHPEVETERRGISIKDAYDLALADTLVPDTPVVTNDLELAQGEHIIVVTGPNQGGKTTFARTVGQLHYLASLGLPVPAARATLMLTDHVDTLFERGENLQDMRGHLHDDLERAHEVLAHATSRTLLVINEIFTSTSLEDADFLSRKVLDQIVDCKTLCVFVTFMDELSTLSDATVSYVAEVDPDHPDTRTFKITRRPADGLAHAKAVAARHGLDAEQITRRLS